MDKIIKILHIPKTGGTAIRDSINPLLIEKKLNDKILVTSHSDSLINDEKYNYIFFLRNPIDRFVSAFISRYRKGYPKYNIEWTESEKFYFEKFKTPNELGENLYKTDESINMIKNISHLNNSFYRFFRSEENLERCKDKILFVGITENLNKDFYKMCDKLKLKNVKLLQDDILIHKTPEDYNYMKFLSEESINNLKKYYEKDFKMIEKAYIINLINKEQFNLLTNKF
jgi:hypothetical protein